MSRASSLGSGRGLGCVSLHLNQLVTQGDRNKEPWWPWSHLFCQSTCCHHPLWDIHCHSNTTPTACWAAQFHRGFRSLHLSLILYHLPANAYLFPLSLSVFFTHLPPSLTHTVNCISSHVHLCDPPILSPFVSHSHRLAPDCFNRWIGEFSISQ